eukprot:CAMPEP_0175139408 /NCGR_PEP_ID=MMETSP0087-20121206/10883_1 /TAXON_ID=136419 /ORGANISM="Unknown Unknown, Strain D1" /LENGTH=228 /DNA_ID=CAMNT_0016422409 /DNA_START=41 /DNA_END=727 /DNA_ORIENTATION=+
MSFASIPPNPTIYLSNLNEKLKKDVLKQQLYLMFSTFGNVLEIHVYRTDKLRGQAWVVYDSLAGATKALRESQGFEFFGKSIKASYAKKKSDIFAKLDGTYKPKKFNKLGAKEEPEPEKKEPKKADRKMERIVPKAFNQVSSTTKEVEENPPNRILFLENLPEETETMMLAVLFQQYTGYKEARLIDGKPGIAFVEFSDSYQATTAKDSLQGFLITPTRSMKISFARQ